MNSVSPASSAYGGLARTISWLFRINLYLSYTYQVGGNEFPEELYRIESIGVAGHAERVSEHTGVLPSRNFDSMGRTTWFHTSGTAHKCIYVCMCVQYINT